MTSERLKLLPWLRRHISSGAFEGLRWENRSKTEFRINWKHGSRQEYRAEQDACVFKAWAIHTGRYREGIDTPLPKKWKANFRCALNSLPEIVAVKDRGMKKGSRAYRVFKIRTRPNIMMDSDADDDVNSSDDAQSEHDFHGVGGMSAVDEHDYSNDEIMDRIGERQTTTTGESSFDDFANMWVKREEEVETLPESDEYPTTLHKPLLFTNAFSTEEMFELIQDVISPKMRTCDHNPRTWTSEKLLNIKKEPTEMCDLSFFNGLVSRTGDPYVITRPQRTTDHDEQWFKTEEWGE